MLQDILKNTALLLIVLLPLVWAYIRTVKVVIKWLWILYDHYCRIFKCRKPYNK